MFYHKCNICGKKVDFTSIEGSLGETLKRHNFPYNLSDFETLSYRNYGCPNCGSSDRDRLYKLYLEKYIDSSTPMSIVDFAPSDPLLNYLKSRKNIEYRSADLMMDGVDDKVDITDMKEYKKNSFDFFVCSHIIEHVSDDMLALKELFRILKPGGMGILMTPIIDKNGAYDEDINEKNISERWRRFAQDDHVRLYEKKVFLEHVRAADFEIEEYGFRKLGLWSTLKNGISLKSKLYIVKKSS